MWQYLLGLGAVLVGGYFLIKELKQEDDNGNGGYEPPTYSPIVYEDRYPDIVYEDLYPDFPWGYYPYSIPYAFPPAFYRSTPYNRINPQRYYEHFVPNRPDDHGPPTAPAPTPSPPPIATTPPTTPVESSYVDARWYD